MKITIDDIEIDNNLTYQTLIKKLNGIYFKNRKKAMFDIYLTLKYFKTSGNYMFIDEFRNSTAFYYYIRLPILKSVFYMDFDVKYGYVYKVYDNVLDTFIPST